MSRWSPAAGQPPAEREPYDDPAVVLGSSGPTRVSREDDADPDYEPPRVLGFTPTTEDVQVFRYFPPEDDCDHAGANVGRLRVESGQVVGHADVLWCPACNSVVGPAPVEPLLWDGDQA